MTRLRHLALFFRRSDDPLTLYWVYCPDAAGRSPAILARLVLAGEPDLEFVYFGNTDYCIDEEFFETGGRTKRLVYLDDCHREAYAAAFGAAFWELEERFVRRNTKRIGFIEGGRFRPCEPEVVERVRVTPMTIPETLAKVL